MKGVIGQNHVFSAVFVFAQMVVWRSHVMVSCFGGRNTKYRNHDIRGTFEYLKQMACSLFLCQITRTCQMTREACFLISLTTLMSFEHSNNMYLGLSRFMVHMFTYVATFDNQNVIKS